jgi:serine/threonine protein kinase
VSSLIGRNLGQYEVRDVIGHGGMASVYLGYRADVDRTVAIKVLPPHPGLNEEAKQRFQLEARTIANLQHPHILPLYDYGATEDGVLYLVMPYVRGGSLDRIVRDGNLPLEKIMRLVREISGALDYAHRQGVIHRDIKPANILLDGEGNALLADFGIVKLTGGDSRLTGTSVVGTPAYMSPEQAQGFDLTTRADLYSFGIVIWELLTGQLPFSSDSVMNLMLKHITDPVPDITSVKPSLPDELNAVMQKLLAKNAGDRYVNGAAFNEAFHRAAAATRSSDITQGETAHFDTPLPDRRTPPPSTPSRSTPAQPLHIKLSGDRAPITVPIDPTDPNRPGTIVIQSPPSQNNLLLFGIVGVVALIAVAALVIVLTGGNNRQPDPTPQPTAQQAATLAPTLIARIETGPTFGRASFSNSGDELSGDSFNLRVQDFAPAPTGKSYIASLVNTASRERLTLGRVTVDAVGDGALSYIDTEGRFLPALFNAVEITLEDSADSATFEDVRYHSVLPVAINDMIHEVFIESENGFRNRGLLETAMFDARFAQQHAGLAAASETLDARRVHNEHTLNILLGGRQDFDGSDENGVGENPGTQIGLLPMLDQIETVIAAVTNRSDTPSRVRTEAELVRVCINNVRDWAGEVINFEQSMLLAETKEASDPDAEQSTIFADRLLAGFDGNENGTVEPFEGECGLNQIETFGLVMASFDLQEFPDSAGE